MTEYFVVVHHRVRGDGENGDPETAFYGYDTLLSNAWEADTDFELATTGADVNRRRISFEANVAAESVDAAFSAVVKACAELIDKMPEHRGLMIDKEPYSATVEPSEIEDEHHGGHRSEQAM